MISFKDLALAPEIQKALDALGFTNPTDIQSRAIPVLLTPEKIDVHGQAQTGTGKTLAFGIPLLQKIDPKKRAVQGLIVAPTRELVVQITESLRKVAQYLPIVIEPIYGGVSMSDQIHAVARGAQIVVGTPGRLNDHIRRRTLNLSELQYLILDEADIMLDMGFKEDVDFILTHSSKNRQIWLFSATVKQGISDIMRTHMKNPVTVQATSKGETTSAQTKQYYCVVPQRNRIDALCRIVDSSPEFYGFVFCPTKVLTGEVADKLIARGYRVNALHGDLSQVQRNRIIKKFKEKDFTVLIATDVAARGIDVANATHVINYSLPEDLESYVHRIGRTGRAGKEGVAITFINSGERRRIQLLERKFKTVIQPLEIPTVASLAQIKSQEATQYVKSLIEQDASKRKYVETLQELVDKYSVTELKEALLSVLYDKFLKNIVKEGEIPTGHLTDAGGQAEHVELFVSLGHDDRIEKHQIIELLVGTNKVTKDQIHRIKILRGHTFVVVPADVADALVEAAHSIQGPSGKRLRISITGQSPYQQRESRGGFGRDRDGGRKQFHRKGRSFSKRY